MGGGGGWLSPAWLPGSLVASISLLLAPLLLALLPLLVPPLLLLLAPLGSGSVGSRGGSRAATAASGQAQRRGVLPPKLQLHHPLPSKLFGLSQALGQHLICVCVGGGGGGRVCVWLER